MRFKACVQKYYPYREELEQTELVAGYGSSYNIQHGDMEDDFMNFSSATAACDAAFTELTTTNGNLYTQLRHQDDQVRSLQAVLCNIKVATATKTTKVKGNNKVGD